MGKPKIKFAKMKAMIKPTDDRIKEVERKIRKPKEDPQEIKKRYARQVNSAMYLRYNTELGPPYHILVDTNFVNFSVKKKLDVIKAMTDCLISVCIPYITDCVMGEFEKLGPKYKIALRIIKDPRFKRLKCNHKGIYADDCLLERVTAHRCYIVATCDRGLRTRIMQIPGVPIMYLKGYRYTVEGMPDAFGAPR